MALRVRFRVRATKRSAGPPGRRAARSGKVCSVRRRSSEETRQPSYREDSGPERGPQGQVTAGEACKRASSPGYRGPGRVTRTFSHVEPNRSAARRPHGGGETQKEEKLD